MKTLLIDTSLKHTQFAVFDGKALNCSHSEPQQRRSGDVFHLKLKEALEQAGCDPQALDQLVVTMGPGSFTGIRIGLATAKSLGLALNKPVYGISTLQALVYQIEEQETDILIAIDSRRGDYFVQNFDGVRKRPTDDMAVLNAEALKEKQNQKSICVVIDGTIDLSVLNEAFLAKQSEFVTGQSVKPLYIRDADAERAKNLPDIDWSLMDQAHG